MNQKHIRLLALLLTLFTFFALLPMNAVQADEAEVISVPTAEEADEGYIQTLAAGTDPYDNFVGTVGSADAVTHNVFVAVGRGMTITTFNGTKYTQGTLDTTTLNSDLATIEEITDDSGTEAFSSLRFRGLKEGVTSFQISDTTFRLYVVPNIASYAQNSKTIKIKVAEISNSTSYFSINAGDLRQIEGTGYLINQTFVGGFQISFFTAPQEGYALTKMYVSGTAGQYYSLGDGTRSDGSDCEAWPFNNPDAAGKDDAAGWKIDRLNHEHGYKTPLTTSSFMSVDRLRQLYAAALALGCDGTCQFGNYGDGSNRNAEITFSAEPLSKMTKSITHYKLSTAAETDEWSTYDPENPPELRLGAKLEYTFTITRSNTQNVEYTDVLLTDNQIGYKLLLTYDITSKSLKGYIGGEVKENADYTFDSSQTQLPISVEYTINSDDLSKYSGGTFKNSATLSYQYNSIYSAGKYSVSQSSEATCKIYGLATYEWDSSVPAEIQQAYSCPASHEFEANKESTVQGQELAGQSVVLCTHGTWKRWTFKGWNLKQDGKEDVFYHPGDSLTLTDYDAKNATLIGFWDSKQLDHHTVTYEWSGLPEHSTCENAHPEIPTDGNPYYETQSYTVDGYYEQGSTHKHGEDVYVFSGWILDGKVVSGDLVMGSSDVTLTGTWKKQSDLTDLIIQVSGCKEALDENQTFLFHVTGEGLDMTLTIHGNGNATISGLDVGKSYTVTQLTDWSWRYTTETGKKSITLTTGEDKVEFPQARTSTKWLDGNAFWNILKSKEEGD